MIVDVRLVNMHSHAHTLSDLDLGLFAGFTVEAADSPALQQLVVSGVGLHLLSPEGGAVAGLQIGLFLRGFVLRWSLDGFYRLHILVGLELSPGKRRFGGV